VLDRFSLLFAVSQYYRTMAKAKGEDFVYGVPGWIRSNGFVTTTGWLSVAMFGLGVASGVTLVALG
jgi:hypothetical protein